MNVTYKKYLTFTMFAASFLIIAIALVNYQIDPAKIYHYDSSASVFADKLVKSSNGLLFPNNSWNEREIKSLLAKNDTIGSECVIIGSSITMQISSFRNNASLKNICPSIVNLGVSGGALEGYMALSYMLINKNNKPKTIVFGIGPETLNFRMDARWEKYKQEYYLMESQLEGSSFSKRNQSSQFKYFINLINPQYFYRSLQIMGKDEINIEETPKFDLSLGTKEPVLLPDGSLIYSKQYILDNNLSTTPIGVSPHKIKKNPQHSDRAVLVFKKLTHLLRNANIDVVIIMTPYHHNVWQDNKSVSTRALLEMGLVIKELGKALRIKVLGSYNPNNIGCRPDEFYDLIHAKDTCLMKISN